MYFFLLEYLNRSRHPLLKTAVFFFSFFHYFDSFILFSPCVIPLISIYPLLPGASSSSGGSQIEFWTFIEIQWTYRNKFESSALHSPFPNISLTLYNFYDHFPPLNLDPWLLFFFFFILFLYLFILSTRLGSHEEKTFRARERPAFYSEM